MTPRRPWPNSHKEARDTAAMEAITGIKSLKPILREKLPPEEIYRRVGIAIDSLHNIKEQMRTAGAPITNA